MKLENTMTKAINQFKKDNLGEIRSISAMEWGNTRCLFKVEFVNEGEYYECFAEVYKDVSIKCELYNINKQ